MVVIVLVPGALSGLSTPVRFLYSSLMAAAYSPGEQRSREKRSPPLL